MDKITWVLAGAACGAIALLAYVVGDTYNVTTTGVVILIFVTAAISLLLGCLVLNPGDEDIRPGARVLAGAAGAFIGVLAFTMISGGVLSYSHEESEIPYVISQAEAHEQR